MPADTTPVPQAPQQPQQPQQAQQGPRPQLVADVVHLVAGHIDAPVDIASMQLTSHMWRDESQTRRTQLLAQELTQAAVTAAYRQDYDNLLGADNAHMNIRSLPPALRTQPLQRLVGNLPILGFVARLAAAQQLRPMIDTLAPADRARLNLAVDVSLNGP